MLKSSCFFHKDVCALDIAIPKNVSAVLERLEENGYEAYIVGGCVRDSILGITPSDYDITTNAAPEQLKQCFSGFRLIETGIKHGTVTVVSDGENIEVTTYRVDGEYLDHRKPESVRFTASLEEDLARRDFTINAMAYSYKRGIVDIFGGEKDLFNRRIKCVGDPAARFDEDALRILRALRFASSLGFYVEPATSLAVHEKKSLLRDISAERIRNELMKLVCGTSPADVMLEYSDVFSFIIPELAPCVGFDQRSRYHLYDVWEHTAHAVENSQPDTEVRIALLFHDIEKPSCFHTDEEGAGHFPNHELRSAETAEKVMKRLKFDNHTIKNVCTLIKYHYLTPIDDKKVVKRLISVLGFPCFNKLTEVMKGDNRAKQGFCLERVNTLEAMKLRAKEIEDSHECCTLGDLAINGNDLEKAGLKGKAIGETLSTLLSMVIDEKLPNSREELLSVSIKLKNAD